ncbi:hypothetical protein ACP70R_047180 [Stipagrostis hirtigluma subsp. patula]
MALLKNNAGVLLAFVALVVMSSTLSSCHAAVDGQKRHATPTQAARCIRVRSIASTVVSVRTEPTAKKMVRHSAAAGRNDCISIKCMGDR